MITKSHTEANALPALTRLNQKLKREELKLARLRSRENENRVRDTRLKYRLGRLIFLIGWERSENAWLEAKLSDAREQLNTAEQIEQHRSIGADELQRRKEIGIKTNTLSTSGLTEDQRQSLNHQFISLGGLMIKHGLDQLPRDAVFGKLMVLRSGSE